MINQRDADQSLDNGGTVPESTERKSKSRTDSNGLEFAWVVFYKNPRKTKPTVEIRFGSESAQIKKDFFESNYVGDLCDEPENRIKVFPADPNVESALNALSKKESGLKRWTLPVWIERKGRVYLAYRVDEKKFSEVWQASIDQLSNQVNRRLTAFEQTLHELVEKVRRLVKKQVAERVLVVVDFQNLEGAVKELLREGRRVFVGIEDIISAVQDRKEGINTEADRVVTKVLIFDYMKRNPFSEQLRQAWQNRGWQFVPIRHLNGSTKNITDQIIAEKTFKEMKDGEYDTLCLVSGDGDFANLVQGVKGLGKKVIVASFQRNVNLRLLVNPDWFLNIDRIAHPRKRENGFTALRTIKTETSPETLESEVSEEGAK